MVLSINAITGKAGDTSLPVEWKAPYITRFILLKMGNAHHYVCLFSCSLHINNLDKIIPLDHKLTTDKKCHHIEKKKILILELKLTFFSEPEKEKDIVWSN